jgi:hypothetical protein
MQHKLYALRTNVNAIKESAGSSIQNITLRHNNYKLIKEISNGLEQLSKRVKSEEEKKGIEKLNQELESLSKKNTNVRSGGGGLTRTRSTRLSRYRERYNPKDPNDVIIEINDNKHVTQVTKETQVTQVTQMQTFTDQVNVNNKKMDEYLDVISQGIGVLQQTATDIGQNLDTQKEQLSEVDDHIDKTLAMFATGQNRIVQLLDDNHCGIEVWCPVIIMLIIVLALIGYIISFL